MTGTTLARRAEQERGEQVGAWHRLCGAWHQSCGGEREPCRFARPVPPFPYPHTYPFPVHVPARTENEYVYECGNEYENGGTGDGYENGNNVVILAHARPQGLATAAHNTQHHVGPRNQRTGTAPSPDSFPGPSHAQGWRGGRRTSAPHTSRYSSLYMRSSIKRCSENPQPPSLPHLIGITTSPAQYVSRVRS